MNADKIAILSMVAAWCTAVIAAGGIIFVWQQIKQVKISLQSGTNERLMAESLEILRFLADHPGNYDYFYHSKDPPETQDESLKCATEMIANYLEHVVLQKDTLPKEVQETWYRFVTDTYARSPIVRSHLKKYRDWYDVRLHEMVANVKPKDPLEL
jgi:hypothetical protein